MPQRIALIILIIFGLTAAVTAVPPKLELLGTQKIWDQAPHNAFTDLIAWKNSLYCAFREGRSHVSTDGRIRILRSTDGQTWESAALVSFQGYDFRDAHLSVTPDDRLMLLGGAAPRKKDNESAPTGSFVTFSDDGTAWTTPQIVVEPGRWLWQVTWHDGKAYGVSYSAPGDDKYLALLVSTDGLKYEPLVPRLFDQGYPDETTLRFAEDGTCYALVRRDRYNGAPTSPVLGVSKPDYTKWQWHDLGSEFNSFGGPNFIELPCGQWIAAGRMHQGGTHTALASLDVRNAKMTPLLRLPSGGDTSYCGLLWYNDLLLVSYYSSHEGKTAIYLARVKVTEADDAQTDTK